MGRVVDTSSLVTDADLEDALQPEAAAPKHKGASQILSEMTGQHGCRAAHPYAA